MRGNKIVTISFPNESYELDTTLPSKDEVGEIREDSVRTIYQSYLEKIPTGDVKVDTFIIQSNDGRIESIEKDFYFSKMKVYSIYATYKADKNNSNEMEVLNSLEQFFLSLKVD